MSYNETCCNIKDEEIARLRASHAELLRELRKHAILFVERPMEGGRFTHHGWRCAICESYWLRNAVEEHDRECVIANAEKV